MPTFGSQLSWPLGMGGKLEFFGMTNMLTVWKFHPVNVRNHSQSRVIISQKFQAFSVNSHICPPLAVNCHDLWVLERSYLEWQTFWQSGNFTPCVSSFSIQQMRGYKHVRNRSQSKVIVSQKFQAFHVYF